MERRREELETILDWMASKSLDLCGRASGGEAEYSFNLGGCNGMGEQLGTRKMGIAALPIGGPEQPHRGRWSW